jgi:DNA-binding transcriptional LysR family regulator
MTESLMDFRNTLAIVTKVVENPEIVYTPLVSEQVILIASPEHRLANLKELMENPDLVLACEE